MFARNACVGWCVLVAKKKNTATKNLSGAIPRQIVKGLCSRCYASNVDVVMRDGLGVCLRCIKKSKG